MIAPPLLLRALREPHSLRAYSLAHWELLVRQARRANLLASLHETILAQGLQDVVPAAALRHAEWASVLADKHAEAVRWEVQLIGQALAASGVTVTLLKGAAYVLAGLPPARGRLFADVDILVAKSELAQVEAALMLHGWIATHHDAYDQRYYRRWMHELPPMRHARRMTVIDVHHAILPETARLRPSSDKLRAAAVTLAGDAPLRVLAPVDMLLHSATHLFHEAELEQGLRDLVDLDRLLRHFGGDSAFWPALAARAQELDLQRPLFYALRYCVMLLGTPVPSAVQQGAGAPHAVLLALMDALYLRALLPAHASCTDAYTAGARALLYLRATWLRMPPLLLVRHLLHKALLSRRAD